MKLMAQNNQPTEVYFQNGSSTVATIDPGGNFSTQRGVFAGNTGTTSGQIDFLGIGSTGGSLTIAAPSAFSSGTGAINPIWTLPSNSIPTGYPSVLQVSPSGAMSYGVITQGNGIVISQGAGYINFSLGSMLNLGGSNPTLNDSGGSPILGLSSSGTGNYVTITNDTSTSTPPAGPQIAVTGPGAGAIPLQVGDRAGGGVELNSNGGVAMKVASTTASPAAFVSVNATPAGTYAGNSAVQVAAANAAGTGDLSLVVKGQNNGSVYVGSNMDVASAAVAFELPADGTTGVTKGRLVIINSSGNAISPLSNPLRPMLGVSLNTTTSGAAIIAYAGKVLCAFENTAVPGDYVVQGASFPGKCRDNGTSYPAAGTQLIGIVPDSTGDILLRVSN